MMRLSASGRGEGQTAERRFERGEVVGLGHESDWCISWEKYLSDRHVEIFHDEKGFHIQVMEKVMAEAHNPVFYQGRPRQAFLLKIGEHFVIGETIFRAHSGRLTEASQDPTLTETNEFDLEVIGYSVEEVRAASFHNADERLEVLSGLHEVIRSASDDTELYERLVLLLLAGIPAAGDAAIVRLVDENEQVRTTVEVLCWECRNPSEKERGFKPSRRLTRDAIENRRVSVRGVSGVSDEDIDATMGPDESRPWSFCIPVPGAACSRWAFYVNGSSGPFGLTEDLRPDLKFAELVAEVLGALRDNQTLEQQQSTLRRFFSPSTVRLLASDDAEKALTPRQVRVTVLFCDLRG